MAVRRFARRVPQDAPGADDETDRAQVLAWPAHAAGVPGIDAACVPPESHRHGEARDPRVVLEPRCVGRDPRRVRGPGCGFGPQGRARRRHPPAARSRSRRRPQGRSNASPGHPRPCARATAPRRPRAAAMPPRDQASGPSRRRWWPRRRRRPPRRRRCRRAARRRPGRRPASRSGPVVRTQVRSRAPCLRSRDGRRPLGWRSAPGADPGRRCVAGRWPSGSPHDRCRRGPAPPRRGRRRYLRRRTALAGRLERGDGRCAATPPRCHHRCHRRGGRRPGARRRARRRLPDRGGRRTRG